MIVNLIVFKRSGKWINDERSQPSTLFPNVRIDWVALAKHQHVRQREGERETDLALVRECRWSIVRLVVDRVDNRHCEWILERCSTTELNEISPEEELSRLFPPFETRNEAKSVPQNRNPKWWSHRIISRKGISTFSVHIDVHGEKKKLTKQCSL